MSINILKCISDTLCEIRNSTEAQPIDSQTFSGSGTAVTPLADTGPGIITSVTLVSGGAVNLTIDGTNPSTSPTTLIFTANDTLPVDIPVTELSNVQFVGGNPSSVYNITYVKV